MSLQESLEWFADGVQLRSSGFPIHVANDSSADRWSKQLDNFFSARCLLRKWNEGSLSMVSIPMLWGKQDIPKNLPLIVWGEHLGPGGTGLRTQTPSP